MGTLYFAESSATAWAGTEIGDAQRPRSRHDVSRWWGLSLEGVFMRDN
jgi:hypothetical protein